MSGPVGTRTVVLVQAFVAAIGRGPLGERQFRLLAMGRSASLVGAAIAPIAIAFAALQLHESAAAVALVVGGRMAAHVAFMLVGGVWADRLPRHRVIVGADIVSGCAQLLTAVLLLLGNAELWQLVVLQMIGGASASFLLPALNGVVPQVVEAHHRQEANAILGVVRDGGRLSGAALGGLLVAAIGPGWALALDAATFFTSASLIARLRLPQAGVEPPKPFTRELADGFSEFRTRTWMWVVSAQFAFVNAIGIGSFLVLGPLVAKRALDGPTSWGLILTGQMAGFVLGGFIAFRIRPHRPLLSAPLASAALAPPLLLLSVGADTLPIAVAAAGAGAALAVFDVLYMTTMQTEIPPDRLARVTSYAMLASFAPIPVGVVTIGAIASVAGVSGTLQAAAAVSAGAAVAVLVPKALRGFVASPWRAPVLPAPVPLPRRALVTVATRVSAQ